MPYIKESTRQALAEGMPVTEAGELNYSITSLLKKFWVNSPRNYQAINDIIGALEGAKAEFQRRIVVPYEDNKIRENGDVY